MRRRVTSHCIREESHLGWHVSLRMSCRHSETQTAREVDMMWSAAVKEESQPRHPATHPSIHCQTACPEAPALIVELGLILAAWGPNVELLHGHQLWTPQLNISPKPQVDVFMWKTGVWAQLATQEFSKRFQMGSKHLKVTAWTTLACHEIMSSVLSTLLVQSH